MPKKKKVLTVSGIVTLSLFACLWLFGAKPAPNVQLKASFRGLTDPAFQGTPEFYVDKFLNDAQGPYMTYKSAVSVWFTPVNGELQFSFEHHSGRSMLIIFPNAGNECGWLPDTAGNYPGLPYEPVDFFKFKTYNSQAFAEPRLNFLTMPLETPLPVRLWTTICTTQRHYFFMNFSQDVGKITGVVEVIAHDLNGDLKPERWEIYPIPGTGDMAKVYKHPETGDDSINCLFGEFPMPFKLILEKR
jgi:hypothetical protein